jgi:hypothetical protein
VKVDLRLAGIRDMKQPFYAPYVLLALALVGIAVAFYDAYQLYNGQPLWCPSPINGCNEVANSPYVRIYNLPVGYFGVVYYLYMLGLAALLAFDPFPRGLRFKRARIKAAVPSREQKRCCGWDTQLSRERTKAAREGLADHPAASQRPSNSAR